MLARNGAGAASDGSRRWGSACFKPVLSFLAVAILLLGLDPQTGRPPQADAGSLSGSNRLDVWVEDSLRAAQYLNRFDIQYVGGPWVVSARLELDEEDRWDPKRGTEITKRYAEYRPPSMTLRAGTFYATFGRGLLLRAMEDEDVRVDRDLDGVYGSVTWKALEGQGFVGRPRNDDTFERDDLLSGIDLGLQISSDLAIGGGYVRQDANSDAGGGASSPDLGRAIEELAGARLQWTRGPVDAFVETAKRIIRGESDPRGGWTGTDAKDGYGWYGSLTMGTPGYMMLLEGKDYLRFDAPYSTPPPVNNEGQPINDGRDERGLGLSITASPALDITFEGNSSWAEARHEEGKRCDAQGSLRKDWWGRGAIEVGGEWIKEEKLEGHDERELCGPTFEASYYLNPDLSLALKGYVYSRSDSLPGWRDEYTETSLELTLSHSAARSATLSMIKASDPIREYGADDLWLSLQISWSFGYNHDLLIKIGEERGGITCSGGICHYEPPFSGVRAELVSRL